jgi:hypothetical protein
LHHLKLVEDGGGRIQEVVAFRSYVLVVLVSECQIKLRYLKSIVGPGTELHEACLLVEGEVPHIDLTGGLENGGRSPNHFARVVQHSLRHRSDNVLSVRTTTIH